MVSLYGEKKSMSFLAKGRNPEESISDVMRQFISAYMRSRSKFGMTLEALDSCL
ncbi:MAG: hypothetical protein RCG15_07110 [Candidatus Rickettsia vulgarisii]